MRTREGALTLGAESVHLQRFFDLSEAPQGLAILVGTLVFTTKWFASTWSRLFHATLLICISTRVYFRQMCNRENLSTMEFLRKLQYGVAGIES